MKYFSLSITLTITIVLFLIIDISAQDNTNFLVKNIYSINIYNDTPKNAGDYVFVNNCHSLIIFNKSAKKIDYLYDAYEVLACGEVGYMDRKFLDISSNDLIIIEKWKQEDREIRLELAKRESEKLDSIQKKKEELERKRIESIRNREDSLARTGLLKKIKNTYNLGLLLYWSWYENDVLLVSQNFNFHILNQGSKTIKYINFAVTLYNPVNDIVAVKTLQGIGPIKPKASGVYNFENAYFSKVVDHVKIKSINIIYNDGSSKLLPMSLVEKITLNADEWEYLQNQ